MPEMTVDPHCLYTSTVHCTVHILRRVYTVWRYAHPYTYGEVHAEKGTYRVQPHHVQLRLGSWPLWDWHGPLATCLASGVFPLGLNPLLEQVEVCSWREPAGWLDVVVQAAKTITSH
jgi:hypothetical protein